MVFIVIPLTNLPVILPQVGPGCSVLSQAAYSFILFFCSFSVFLSPLTERTWLALWHRAPSAADTPASPVLIYLSLSCNDLLLHWCSSYTVKKVKHVNSTLVTKMLSSSSMLQTDFAFLFCFLSTHEFKKSLQLLFQLQQQLLSTT